MQGISIFPPFTSPSIHSPNTIKYCLERYISSIKYNWYSCIYSIRDILWQKGKEYKSGSEKATKKAVICCVLHVLFPPDNTYCIDGRLFATIYYTSTVTSAVKCVVIIYMPWYTVMMRRIASSTKKYFFDYFFFFLDTFFFARKVPFFWQQTYFIAVFLCFLYRYFTIISMYKYILYIGIIVCAKSMHYSIAIASCFRGCLDGLLPSLDFSTSVRRLFFSFCLPSLKWNIKSVFSDISYLITTCGKGRVFIHFFSLYNYNFVSMKRVQLNNDKVWNV